MKFQMKNHLKICLIVSGAIMLIALLMTLFGFGMNLGIDFTGGIIMQYEMGQDFDVDDIREALEGLGISESQIAKAGEGQTEAQIRIKDVENSDDVRAAFEESLAEKYPAMQYISVERVGAVAGQSLIRNALLSVLVAWILMLCYIAIRFDLYSGIAAVAGILHDVLIMLSFMVILRSFIQINSTFIAALLTIVGYSINNTIVIFDRIRENARKTGVRNLPKSEIVSISVTESLPRTINTTLTTLMTTVTLYVLGVSAIREFALPLIIGMLSGIYSSNMINGYIWALLMDRRAKKKELAGKGKVKTKTKQA